MIKQFNLAFHLFAVSLNENHFISPIDRLLSGVTTPGQSGPWINSSEAVLCIPQSSSIICFLSYPGHLFLPPHTHTAEMQPVYSTSNTDWAV